MPTHLLRTTLALLLTCPLVHGVHAQARDDDALARTAITSAEIGVPAPPLPASHPLRPWQEYAALRRDIDTIAPAVAQAFLSRNQGQPVATLLREAWLASLAKREDWRTFLDAWSGDVKGPALRCHALTARLRNGGADARWTADAQAAWQAAARPPQACDVPFEQLTARGGVSPAMRWQRIEQASADAQPALMRAAAAGLAGSEAALARDYAAFVEAPH
ncbi:MAG TPA: lytic murein transglycosylase, partial [Luteimonas sp.]|nr:lytic murein transglycosylase [Luteimonas sp.]